MVQQLDELMQHDPDGRNAHAMLKPERNAAAQPNIVPSSTHAEVPPNKGLTHPAFQVVQRQQSFAQNETERENIHITHYIIQLELFCCISHYCHSFAIPGSQLKCIIGLCL